MKKYFLLALLTFSYNVHALSSDSNLFKLQEGDLLFQDIDCGPLCDAIEKVTKGINGGSFSHIGLAVKDSLNNLVILEAIGENVRLTPLEKFITRSSDSLGNPKVIVGRLKSEYSHLIPGIIKEADSYLGKPYDDEYLFTNDSYYCSEVIYLAALKANDNVPLFELQPMTFRDPDTRDFYPAWVKYYEDLEMKIPEGEPGLNPGGISLSDKINIVYIYGYPDGWRK